MSIQSTIPVLQVSTAIEQTIADVIAYLPTLISALVILVIGYIIGRIVGGIVTRVVRSIGISKYTQGTAIEEVGSGDGVSKALGKIVAYYIYFVALLAAADVLGIPQLTDLLSELAAFLPVILGALVVLVIGFVIARILGDIVSGIVGSLGVGQYLRETPLEPLSESEGEFGRLVGKLVTYYVYLLTLMAVADILAIGALSSLLNTFAAYLPVLIAGFIVLLVGIWIAERVGELIADTDDSRMIQLASVGVKLLIYYITITIVLATIGFNITTLTTLFTAFVAAFFGALALALAIGIGIAVGLGGQDYVAENIDGWMDTTVGTVTDEESTDAE
ncbi:mechanosensitive ion channel family protein [Natronomonas amylolytica]|uniref:mechanosensitive ion channel family protein n=1 Tax=Natronomonas amylolytica TaxID=3108498 RepID=UPI00300A6C1D